VIRNCGPDNVFPAVVECDPEDSTYYHTTYRFNFIDEPLSEFTSCSLCPAGIDDILDLEVSNGFQTCGELENIAATAVTAETCDNFLLIINGQADNTALCCASVDAAPTCSLCLGGAPIDPSALPAFGGNLTCGEYTDFASVLVNQTTCGELQSGVAPFCCTGLPGRCSLCPAGSTLGMPDFDLRPFSNSTCGELDAILGFFGNDETCDIRLSFNEILDYQSLCGCSGAEPPNTCSFCGSDDLVMFPDFVIPEADITCGDLNSLAPFIANETICSDFSQAAPFCCMPNDNVTATCGVCANGGVPSFPEKPLVFEDLTCGQGDVFISSLPEDECGVTRDELGIAVGAYCGCEGEVIPDECAFCPEGQEVLTPDRAIPLVGLTCAEAEQFARFITNVTVCETDVAQAGAFCCAASANADADADASAGPTAVGTPTAAPTASSSYARNTAWIATALVGGASIFLAF
jgi:hypothetical protein